jgi:hypothetical protein
MDTNKLIIFGVTLAVSLLLTAGRRGWSWRALKWRVRGWLRRPCPAMQVGQAANGVMCYYIPNDPRDIPAHGTAAYDKGFTREENPFPNWRAKARSRWDEQWDAAHQSYLELFEALRER